jgi:Rrf2 family protein
MIELTRHYGSGPLSITEISRKTQVPVKYLEQLIIPLKKAKLIKSIRGPKGGHMLALPPEEINVWDVLVTLESKMTLVDCVADPSACANSANCPIRPLWGKAYRAMIEPFKQTNLLDILRMNE